MHPVRTLARPLLASVFVTGGIDMLRNASSLAPVAAPVTRTIVDAAQPAVDKAVAAAAPAVETAADAAADLAEQAADAVPDAARPVADLVDGAADAARSQTSGTEGAAPRVTLPDDPELLTTVNGAVMVGAGVLLGLGRLPRISALALAATIVPTTLAAHRFWEISDDDERQAQQIHFMKNVGLLGGLALAAVDTDGRPGVVWRARHGTRTARREARLARRVASSEARRRAQGAAHAVSDALPGGG